MPKYFFSIVAFSIGIFIVFLSTVRLSFPQSTSLLIGTDKLGHFFAYFCFSISVFGSLVAEWKLKKPLKWSVITSLLLNINLEIIQGIFLIHRSFEVYDILANVLGIILFVFLAKRVKKLLSNAVFL